MVLFRLPLLIGELAGSLLGAWFAASWATRLASHALYRVIAILLIVIAIMAAPDRLVVECEALAGSAPPAPPSHSALAERTSIKGHPGTSPESQRRTASFNVRSIARRSAIFASTSARWDAARSRTSAQTTPPSVSDT